jgi:hypothetical protein
LGRDWFFLVGTSLISFITGLDKSFFGSFVRFAEMTLPLPCLPMEGIITDL